MRQHLIAIIALFAAIILALFSFDTASSLHSARSYRTYNYNATPSTWQGGGEVMPYLMPEGDIVSVATPQARMTMATGNFSALPTADSLFNAPPALLATSAMMELTPVQLPPLDAGMVNVTGVFDGKGQAAGYRVTPRMEEFTIAVPYDPELLPQGFTEEDIQTYVYDRQYHRWIAIQRDSVNETELLVCSRFRPWEKGLSHAQDGMINPQDALAQVQNMMSVTAQGEGGVDSPLDFINAVLKTPEMPETSAYTPTSIKELKAADPLEGLTLIQPPTANNSGTANLSYPIEIPAGRQGMQPNLALTYNSGGGNGWLGVGWDISIPSITVETRWGVPRYDLDKESEVYVYDGEQLVTKDSEGYYRQMPHRTNQWTDRHDLDQDGYEQFYPRRNEASDSIVRHGDSPSNYWWSVTHKNGVTDYYGKQHGTDAVDNESVLCDLGTFNIAKWYLTESVDPDGNWVRYHYQKIYHKSVNDNYSINVGTEVYPDSVVYTGHSNASPIYKVVFNLKSEDRDDIVTDARWGFREVMAHTLCNMEVSYRDTILRRYYFVTACNRNSAFKTRLTDVVLQFPSLEQGMNDFGCSSVMGIDNWANESGGTGKADLVRYAFEYFDFPDADSLYGGAINLSQLPYDNINAAFRTEGVAGTALGARKGVSAGFGGTLTVGPDDKNMTITSFNFGGNFNYSQSSTTGLLTLTDMNGDGMADKVFKQNGKIYYRPMVSNAQNPDLFGFGEKVEIEGLRDFLYEENHSPSFGVQGSVPFLAANAGNPLSVSYTNTYFSDVNGDGLTDLVSGDKVLLNSLDENGHPVFSEVNTFRTDGTAVDMNQPIITSATYPCGGIIFDGSVDTSMLCDYNFRNPIITEYDSATLMDIYFDPQYIVVSVDSNNIIYIDTSGVSVSCIPGSAEPDLDAVRVWVAPREGNITITSSIRMLPDSSESFRQSRYTDGIRYTIEKDSNCHIDQNFVLSGDSAVLYRGALGAEDTTGVTNTISTSVSTNDIIFFRLQSGNDRSFDRTEWSQTIRYIGGSSSPDRYGKALNHYSSTEDFILTGRHYFQAPKKGTAIISGFFSGSPGHQDALLEIFQNEIAVDAYLLPADYTDSLTIQLEIDLDQGDSLLFVVSNNFSQDFDPEWGAVSCRPYLRFVGDPNDISFSMTDTLRCYPPVRYEITHETDDTTYLHKLQKFFGPLYRGWGQFAYHNHDAEGALKPIDVSKLILPEVYRDPMSGIDSTALKTAFDTANFHINLSDMASDFTADSIAAVIDTVYNPLSSGTSWVEMTANMEHNAWMGFGNTTMISRHEMCNTRPVMLIPDVNSVDTFPSDITGTVEIAAYDCAIPAGEDTFPVQSIRKGNISVMTNGSLSYIGREDYENHQSNSLSMGGSISNGENYILSDYLDLNGDRYPDILHKKKVQYTMPWGGIGESHFLNYEEDKLCRSMVESAGGSYSGSYPRNTRQPGGSAQKGKIVTDAIGFSTVSSTDATNVMYLDINGDGLPDRVYMEGKVALNNGYGFETKENWNTGVPRSGKSQNSSSSVNSSFSLEQQSISGGIGLNSSENLTRSALMDVNGDGLPDKVITIYDASSIMVRYNKGGGKWSTPDTIHSPLLLSGSDSHSETADGSATLGFGTGIVKFQIGIQISPFSNSFSRDHAQLVDMNGDGYPDYVTSLSETSMIIRYNTASKTNLLKRVVNFTGSSIEMDYDMPASCYDKPQRTWNLASVAVSDPCSPAGGNRSLTTFEYGRPHYDRYERMDYGYDTVIVKQHNTEGGDTLYRQIVTGYQNTSYFKRGRKTTETILDGQGRKYVETIYSAILRDFAGNEYADSTCVFADLFVGRETDLTRYYEGHAEPHVVTATHRIYDSLRNVVRYVSEGDTSRNDEYLDMHIHYRQSPGHNRIALPDTMYVFDSQENLLRKRTAEYDSLGHLSQLQVHGQNGVVAIYDYFYGMFGNVGKVTLPQNASGQRMAFRYTYDALAQTYPVKISNALHHISHAEYDLRFGKPVLTTDVNNNRMRYQYDPVGRLTAVTAPYEWDNNLPWTVKFEYTPHNYNVRDIGSHPCDSCSLSWARSCHYDAQDTTDNIVTTVLADGLGRQVQTRKDAVVGGLQVSIVSGRVVYDCFGRTVRQDYPFTDTSLTETCYRTSPDQSSAFVTEYDIMDRQTKVTQPYDIVTTMEYDFGTWNGKTYFSSTQTDALGNSVVTLSGTRGQTVRQTAPFNTVTQLEYDAIGQLVRSVDPDGFQTTYTYDMLGRMTQRNHTDAGIDKYKYDATGNLILHSNALGDSVKYYYNYHLLTDVSYPRYPANDVHYRYGTNSDTAINAVGRVVLLEDASGWQTFSYGKLGEIIENIRTFALPFDTLSYTFKMQYEYDSYNRLRHMTYPDGEVVSYRYNHGGMLNSITGVKNGVTYKYLDSIRYNRFELKDTVFYGNGTRAEYNYDSLQRLSRLRSCERNGSLMQDIGYTYDTVGNIVGIENLATVLANGLGGAYSSQYTYDSLYRLSSSTGLWTGEDSLSYTVDMDYHANGRVKRKRVAADVLVNGTLSSVAYDNGYRYENPLQPNTLSRISAPEVEMPSGVIHIGPGENGKFIQQEFVWDAGGNLIKHFTAGADNPPQRNFCWDEQNRLMGVADNQNLSLYLYDASGERAYKFTGAYTSQNISGQWRYFYYMDKATLYASPFLVATPQGYTKHYYAENERVASRIGGGGLSLLDTAMDHKLFEEHWELSNQLFEQTADCLEAPYELGEAPLGSLYNWVDTVQQHEDECYWYHPDHLGSSSWITDKGGHAVQHLHYLPWGEDFVNQRTTDFSARHTFSAKEKDVETGLSYFGSRYYSSDLSIWLSVDPMSDKYASLSPYNYCANNPVKLVDPNGEKIDPASQEEWNSNKKQLTATVVDRVFQSVTNPMGNNSSYTNKSIMSLFKTLTIMDQMEQVPNWEFALSSKGGKTTGYTMLTRDPEHNMAYLFKVGYVDMANFVHEITHCGQFLNGEVGFEETDKGFTPFVDIYDELDAYKSQYYYNQNSLPLNKYPILTKDWLYNIKDDIGVYPYRYIGRLSYDGYATEAILKAAYPKSAQVFDNMRGYLFHQPRVIFQIKRKDFF